MRAYRHALSIYLKITTFLFDEEMGRRLAEIRREAQLSQEELGLLLGLNQTGVYRLESGKSRTIHLTAEQFKDALPDHFDYVLLGGYRVLFGDAKVRKINTLRAKIGKGKLQG